MLKSFDGWLGSEAEEGRGQLRKARARRMQPLNPRFPNGTSRPLFKGNPRGLGTRGIETS
ncbi:hypothetical protein DRN50_08470 [Thermococci archaeon]|nr:MAG: hypothetical protein DRN50_08470 [Thermococci archaeon]